MRQNAVPAALARLGASLALCLLMLVPAVAGDRALINFLGYSEDGKYFAFEEFGVHDGSGGVYSSITIVDVVADKWVGGSPIVVDEGGDMDESPPLATVRAKAMALATPKLKQFKVDVPVDIFYLLGEGMGNDKGKTVTFSTPSCCGPGATQDDAMTLVLTPGYAKSDNDYCDDSNSFGFALSLFDANGKRVVHDDGTKIPASRGCPVDYRIYAVITPFEGDGPWIAMISSYPMGFEGPDRRFIAVPIVP